VAFLILLVVLLRSTVVVARLLIILFKPRTATWELILGRSACFGSLSTPGDPARALLFILGVCTVVGLSDTLGGDALFDRVVLRLVDNISVNRIPVIRYLTRYAMIYFY
jgi:hypothetical protein